MIIRGEIPREVPEAQKEHHHHHHHRSKHHHQCRRHYYHHLQNFKLQRTITCHNPFNFIN